MIWHKKYQLTVLTVIPLKLKNTLINFTITEVTCANTRF